MKILVLGAGLVGSVIAADLKDSLLDVTLADIDQQSLEKARTKFQLQIAEIDACAENFEQLIEPYELVVSAVPGFLGFQTARRILSAGKHLVDIAFFAEDPAGLDELAKEKHCLFVPDCGVSPGMSNILIGSMSTELERIDSIEIYVGGLPQVRTQPYEYTAVFSPIDVIEEYIRPARLREFGVDITRPALSEPELVEFEGLGTLEGFNTDGLRTLLTSFSAPNMKEKTLRYPGHRQKMCDLRDGGFFSEEPMTLFGKETTALELSSKILFEAWRARPHDKDMTLLKVFVSGKRAGGEVRLGYSLIDTFDEERQITSMARTTGYTASAMCRAICQKRVIGQGLQLPEILGKSDSVTAFLLEDLAARGVYYRRLPDNSAA